MYKNKDLSQIFHWINGFTLLLIILAACNRVVPANVSDTPAPILAATRPPTATPAPLAFNTPAPATPMLPTSTPPPPPPPTVPANEAAPTSPGSGQVNEPVEVTLTQTQANPYWTTYTFEGDRLGPVNAMLIDEAGRKWFGSVSGLYMFDGQHWQLYTSANGLLNNDVTALAHDTDGNIWVGYETTRTNGEPVGGLSRFDGQHWQHYTIARDVLGNTVRAIAVDPAGRLWFGTGHGLGMFDGQSWTMYQPMTQEQAVTSGWPAVDPPAYAPYIEPNVIDNAPANLAYPVEAVAVDLAGQVWVGGGHVWEGGGGLSMFDGRQWRSYPDFQDVDVRDIAVGAATGEVWVAGRGVAVFDGQSWRHYTQADGLASDSVQTITLDPAGRKWFGTWMRGLSVFDDHAWVTYTKADGLADNTIWSQAVDPDGHVWSGAGRALQVFTPAVSLTTVAALPTPVSYPTPHIDYFTVTPTRALTLGDTISLAWQAQGEKAEICYISGAPVDCQEVPLSGSRAITVDESLLQVAIGQVGLRVTASEILTWSLTTLDFLCRYQWFYDDPSDSCPESPPIYSRGAAQYFERGLMIWSEQPDQFYVFFDEDHQFTRFEAGWVKETNFLATPEPLPTPPGGLPAPQPWPTAPPPGAFEPVSGFGRVWQYFWRFDKNGLPVSVREDIGWATGPEFEFETAYQCALDTSAYGRWGCVLRSPTGTVLGFAPQSTVRDRWFWTEK